MVLPSLRKCKPYFKVPGTDTKPEAEDSLRPRLMTKRSPSSSFSASRLRSTQEQGKVGFSGARRSSVTFNCIPSADDDTASPKKCELVDKLHSLCSNTEPLEQRLSQVEKLLEQHPHIINFFGNRKHLPIHTAAENDESQIMDLLIQHGADIEAPDKAHSHTPLFYAIIKHSHNCFQLLIEKGADVKAVGKDKKSALHVAVEQSSDGGYMVSALLEQGASITVQEQLGYTPLHTAAFNGNNKVLEILLKSCSSCSDAIEICNNKGNVPLHVAAEKGNKDCCSILLKYGANIAASNNMEETPLHLAVKAGFIHTCDLLLSKHKDINIKDKKGNTPLIYVAASLKHSSKEVLKLILQYRPDLNAKSSNGDTALHLASKGGYHEKCLMLVEAGAKCNLKNSTGMTPLHYATKKRFPRCCASILNLPFTGTDDVDQPSPSYHTFCREGEGEDDDKVNKECSDTAENDKHVDVNINDNNGKAAIHYALEKGCTESCMLLLRKRANVVLQTRDEDTPLHLAANKGLDNCCRRLMQRGASVNAVNKQKQTPLHVAAQCGSLSCCQVLQKKGADINLPDYEKKTPLHYAAKVGAVDCCVFLVKKGAKLDVTDKNEKTPVHWAASEGHLDCCKELISGGNQWQLFKKDDRGRMPFVSAFENKHDEIFCCLLQKTYEDKTNKSPETYRSSEINSLNILLRTSICEKRKKATEAIIKSPLWEEALAPLSMKDRGHNLELLIRHYPRLAKDVLDKSIVKTDEYETFKFYLLDDTYYSIESCGSSDSAVLDGVLQHFSANAPCSRIVKRTLEIGKSVKHGCTLGNCIPNFLQKLYLYLLKFYTMFLSKFIYPADYLQNSNREAHKVRKCSLSWAPFDDDGHLKSNVTQKVPEEEQWRKNHPLHIMVECQQLELLKHRLCHRLMREKWDRYVGRLFHFLLFISASFVVALSFYVTLAYDWKYVQLNFNMTQEMVCDQICVTHSASQSLTSYDTLDSQCDASADTFIPEVLLENRATHSTLGNFALLLLFINIIIEGGKLHHLRGICLRGKKAIQMVCYLTAAILLTDWTECTAVTGVREDWQWGCGAFSVLLAWYDLMLLLGMIPQFGIYLFIVSDFLKTILKLLGLMFIQVIAFTFSFHMLLRGKYSFSNIPRALMKISTMMLGDLDYDDHFSNTASPLPYPAISNLLLLCFLGVMVIGMINLVTNLPQSELEKAKEQAQLINLSSYVALLLAMESWFPLLRKRYTVGWVSDKLKEGNKQDDEFNITASTNTNESAVAFSCNSCDMHIVENTHRLIEELSCQIREQNMMLEDMKSQIVQNKRCDGSNRD